MKVQVQRGRVGAARDPLALREWLASMSATGHKIGVRIAADVAHRIEAA